MAAASGILLTLSACDSANSPTPTAAPAIITTSPAVTTTSAPVATTTQGAPTPTATGTRSAVPNQPFTTASQVEGLFVQLVEDHCGPAHVEGSSKPVDPTKATVRRGPTAKQWLVTDKAGDKILINTTTRKVYSTDGPKGMLPAGYTFGCDEKVFLGTWD